MSWQPENMFTVWSAHCWWQVLQCYKHGCGVTTQISSSGSSSKHFHLIFWHRLQHLELFGSGSRTIFGPKTKKHIICITHLNWNPNFRLQLQHLNIFGSGSSHSNLHGLELWIYTPGYKSLHKHNSLHMSGFPSAGRICMLSLFVKHMWPLIFCVFHGNHTVLGRPSHTFQLLFSLAC